jgi:hypothetical protein
MNLRRLAVAVTATVLAASGIALASSANTVAVPHVGRDYFAAYQRLHAAGLRVTIPRPLSPDSLSMPTLGRVSPPPGSRVARGSVVTLYDCRCSALGSPGVPSGPLPRYVVPNFVGARVSAAAAWVRGKALYFRADIGRLTSGNARDLYGNYRVQRQRPRPGGVISLGRRAGTNGGFLPTPVVVAGVQIKRSGQR